MITLSYIALATKRTLAIHHLSHSQLQYLSSPSTHHSSSLGPVHTCQKNSIVPNPAVPTSPMTTAKRTRPCVSVFWIQNAARATEKLRTAYRSATSGMERKHAVIARSASCALSDLLSKWDK